MELPSWIYRSERIGRNSKRFSLYKIRTLKEGFVGNYATEEGYTKWGRFLRKTKLDEIPQILNWLRGDIALVGPRPESPETINLIPKDLRKILLSVKPGLTSLSSVHFWDEEALIQKGTDNTYDYYARIKPAKILLDVFYVQNKCFILKIAVLWMTLKVVLRAFFKK